MRRKIRSHKLTVFCFWKWNGIIFVIKKRELFELLDYRVIFYWTKSPDEDAPWLGLLRIFSSKLWAGHLKKVQSTKTILHLQLCAFESPSEAAKHFSDNHQLKRCPWDQDGCSAVVTFLKTYVIHLDRFSFFKERVWDENRGKCWSRAGSQTGEERLYQI